MHRHPQRFGPLFAILALALSACQSNQTCQLIHVTDLPLTIRDRAFYTTARINGHDVQVQFDTGATDNILSERAAKRLGLVINQSGQDYAQGIGGETRLGEVTSDNVELGDAHGEKLKFTTIADDAWHEDSDGLLGMNFLSGFDIDLDFQGKRVGLYKAIGPCNTPYTALPPPVYSVDFAPQPENHDPLRDEDNVVDISPAVWVQINGVTLRAIIDTGAVHTTIFRDSANRAGLVAGAPIASGTMHGINGRPINADIRHSAPIVIGPLTVRNVPILVADQRHMIGNDLLLGYDFVTRAHLWISKSSNTLIMQFPPQPTPPDAKPAKQ